MPYFEVQNFAAGMDVRKSALTAPAGTLRMLKNAHVTTGGEISKRQAFVKTFTAPAGSVGIVAIDSLLYTFVANGTNITATPTTLGVRSLAMPAGVAIASVLDWDTYGGKFYVIAKGSDGNVYRFFDGALVANGKGLFCRTYKSKVYAVEGSYLYFSAVGDPSNWTDSTKGAGYVNLSTEDSEMEHLTGCEVYYDKLAVFSERACQIWSVDPDPNKNQHVQTLRQAGTYAPRSVRQYGSGDVLYLSPDGIRSLKARAQSITASVSDIGSPLDPYMRTLYLTLGAAKLNKAISLLEPLSGRYWVALENSILVLSNYPNPEISAWCIYEPDFTIADAVAAGPLIYLRADNGDIYRYGNGVETPVYDSCPVEVIPPYLSFGKPATFKQFMAMDCSASGTWDIGVGLNPHDENAEDVIGTVTGPTFLTGQFAVLGHSTHISMRFRSAVPGPCTLSNLMIHYAETNTT